MKNILHVIVGLNVGGAELMLKRLIESRSDDSIYTHSVISLTTKGPVGKQLQAAGIGVYALNMRSPMGVVRTLWLLVRHMKMVRPDIVQTWMYHADLLGGLAAFFLGNKNIIWGIRTADVKSSLFNSTALVRKICSWLSYFLPHTIVCAANASRRVHISLGYDASRMVVVPNGFDIDRLVSSQTDRESLRTQLGFVRGAIVVGCVGRFHPVKDHENFVRAAELVAKENLNVRFLMIGREIDAANMQLSAWINRSGFADRFVLLGEQSDLSTCLAAMDVFCLSSRAEGFPNVVGEAMAIGLPCVVTDVGDAAVLVADTGVVVPKQNFVALAQGLQQLLEMQPAALRKLGDSARARIRAEFTMKCACERFEEIYQMVLRS